MAKKILCAFLLASTAFLFSNGDKGMDIHFIEERVKIDGKLNESFYKDLKPAEDFYQYLPKNGAEPTFKTQVYAFYDRKNIYFSFRCFDDEPGKIIAHVTPFGKYANNDEVKVFIDTYLDKKTYKVFAVNPKGIIKGEQTVWDASARISDDGWSAELKIPFKSLEFPAKDIQHWAINFQRFIPRLNETSYWTKVEKGKKPGDSFGKLEGIKNVKGGKNIEIYPYAGYRGTRLGDDSDNEFIIGADLSYRITPGLTLDFSAAPDYSEVESDTFFHQYVPYEVELPERRAFFVKKSSYFSNLGHMAQLFYSRRITDPDLAAMLTGEGKGFSIGALLAKNRREGAADAFHGVFRFKKYFTLEKGASSHVGLIYSSIEEKGNWNRNIGVDFRLLFWKHYAIKGIAALTYNKDRANSNNGIYSLQLIRTARQGILFNIRGVRIEPDVFIPAGYAPETDIIFKQVDVYYMFSWKNKWLRWIRFGAHYNGQEGIKDSLNAEDTGFLSIWMQSRSQLSFFGYARTGKIRRQIINEAGELVWDDLFAPAKNVRGTLGYRGNPVVQFGFTFNFWDGPVHTLENTEAKKGVEIWLDAWAEFKISPQLQLDMKYEKIYRTYDDGSPRVNGNLVSSRLNVQVSKKLSSFIKFQYDALVERFQYDFLIRFEPASVSKIYFSLKNYSEDRFKLFDPGNRSIAFKVSYLYSF